MDKLKLVAVISKVVQDTYKNLNTKLANDETEFLRGAIQYQSDLKQTLVPILCDNDFESNPKPPSKLSKIVAALEKKFGNPDHYIVDILSNESIPSPRITVTKGFFRYVFVPHESFNDTGFDYENNGLVQVSKEML